MKVAIIGSGISGVTTAKSFIQKNYEVSMFDSSDFEIKYKDNVSFFPNLKTSPKFQNISFVKNRENYLKKYEIISSNFFSANTLEIGGLSNHWGGGLELPSDSYLNQYNNSSKIISEKRSVLNEMGINENNLKFYDPFFDNKVMKKFLDFKSENFYFEKLLLAINQNNNQNNKLTDFQYTNKNIFYNAKNEIFNLIKFKNFKLFKNSFVSNVVKNDEKLKLIINDQPHDQIFDKVILSCGTVGSSIIVSKLLKIDERIRIYHTPMLQTAYYNNPLKSNINIKNNIGLALLLINLKINQDLYKGSFLSTAGINNNFFGISDLNIFFSFIKKFIYVGNIFFPQQYSNTYLNNNMKNPYIESNINTEIYQNIVLIKKKLNFYLKKFGLKQIPFLNCKLLKNGSDAHYTSSLYNFDINNKKILNEKCELNNFKNVYVLDGSVIKEGLYYPTLFLMMYIKHISRQIINDEKKN
jgi:hypothetical protein